MTIRKNILIMSSRPEVLWTRVERSAYQKTIPVADVSTSLDMTLGGGGSIADMNSYYIRSIIVYTLFPSGATVQSNVVVLPPYTSV